MHTLPDYIGAAGVTLLLLAYLFNLIKLIDPQKKVYIWLNILGSALACTASVLLHYKPFIVLEGAWALVSVVALLKAMK
jgi:hypothetical protein